MRQTRVEALHALASYSETALRVAVSVVVFVEGVLVVVVVAVVAVVIAGVAVVAVVVGVEGMVGVAWVDVVVLVAVKPVEVAVTMEIIPAAVFLANVVELNKGGKLHVQCNMVLSSTLLYVEHNKERKKGRYKLVTREVLMAFIGVLLLLGIHNVGNHQKAWRVSKAQYMIRLSDLMTCQTFELIGYFLYVIHVEEEAKIPLISMCMLGSVLRLVKTGYRLMWYCNCMITTTLFTNQGYQIFCDNYYTSVRLFEKLAENGIAAIGIMRVSQKGIPESVKQLKSVKMCHVE